MKKVLTITILALCLTSLIGCASIMTGRHQKIPVTTVPEGATVTCNNQSITTPGELMLLRGEGPYTVKITKAGYWDETVILKKTMSGATAGNALLGGLIGVGVDAVTGAMFKLVPEEINVALNSTSAPRPEPVLEVIETDEAQEDTQNQADKEYSSRSESYKTETDAKNAYQSQNTEVVMDKPTYNSGADVTTVDVIEFAKSEIKKLGLRSEDYVVGASVQDGDWRVRFIPRDVRDAGNIVIVNIKEENNTLVLNGITR